MADEDSITGTGVLLAKLRATDRLLAVSGRADIEPLRPTVEGGRRTGFRLDGSAEWFMVRTDADASPWDQAHARVAEQLGIDESDVEFVEPDLIHTANRAAPGDEPGGEAFGADVDCHEIPQDESHGKTGIDEFAWHLGRRFSRLGEARDMVGPFTAPATRIAHIDTGYWPQHETSPTNVNLSLQRNFVRSDDDLRNAMDPDNDVFGIDNSGHGTGTISILAGGRVSAQNDGILGGAPTAEIVPIRVADRVVLLRTSSLAKAINYAADTGCAVASLSMGGLPARAWADAVDDAYDLGLCLVAAAGNRFGGTPPNSLVYPARYARTIGVTGVMSNGKPYEDLDGLTTMRGAFGPKSVMHSVVAAYSPNIPWAQFGCRDITRLNGEGTSAATPQVAAAAALWIEQFKEQLPNDWRRVEAVRHALFASAKNRKRLGKFGNGILQASKALAIEPKLHLSKSARSSNRWAFLRMLTGLGVDGTSMTEQMFDLELVQLFIATPSLAALVDPNERDSLVADPDASATLDASVYATLIDAVLATPSVSVALRRHLAGRARALGGQSGSTIRSVAARKEPSRQLTRASEPSPPAVRRLRVFAKDPTLASKFATSGVAEVTVSVPWEPIDVTATAFRGEYFEVFDDLAEPVPTRSRGRAIDHPHLLAQDGWSPAPGDLQFHQQMVYAVGMKTVEHFERALGRPVLWRHAALANPVDDSEFVRRLTLRPHALGAANAYYSPSQSEILFGYFDDQGAGSKNQIPVYSCLSADIIAHETTHAVVDGMFRRLTVPTNPDVLAFHEAIADLVALLQVFDLTDLLEYEIAQSRGDIRAETVLGKMAMQFGEAARGREALRSAIGRVDDGEWIPVPPDRTVLTTTFEPHRRGAVLVSAVFDILIAIYEARTADLLRLSSGGTGRLPDGAINPDLTRRLAAEASKSARHLLRMCLRALDYLPPVDVTFFDFLRAMVTADYEFDREDRYRYRVAVVEAFRNRGIGPTDHDASATGPMSMSPDALRWPTFGRNDVIDGKFEDGYEAIVQHLAAYGAACIHLTDRKLLFETTRHHRAVLNEVLTEQFTKHPALRTAFGMDDGRFEVHELRLAMRARPSGRVEPEVMMSVTQSRTQQASGEAPKFRRLGSATVVLNLTRSEEPSYWIIKPVDDPLRTAAAAAFARANTADPLRGLLLAPHEHQFQALHG